MRCFRYYAVVAVGLLVSLFIYLFYRSEYTIINQVALWFFPESNYLAARELVNNSMPLNSFFIYSLPEAIWVFCATMLSKNLFFTVRRYPVRCSYLPLLFAFLWELLQLIHVTNGYFDWWDIISCTVAFLLARRFFRPPYAPVHIMRHFSGQALYFYTVFAIVYLSHVKR